MSFISARNAVRYKNGNCTEYGRNKAYDIEKQGLFPYSYPGTKIERGQKAGRRGGTYTGGELSHSSAASGCPVKDLANMKGSRIIKGQRQEVLPQPGLAAAVQANLPVWRGWVQHLPSQQPASSLPVLAPADIFSCYTLLLGIFTTSHFVANL